MVKTPVTSDAHTHCAVDAARRDAGALWWPDFPIISLKVLLKVILYIELSGQKQTADISDGSKKRG